VPLGNNCSVLAVVSMIVLEKDEIILPPFPEEIRFYRPGVLAAIVSPKEPPRTRGWFPYISLDSGRIGR
jgi:hypothetical protein